MVKNSKAKRCQTQDYHLKFEATEVSKMLTMVMSLIQCMCHSQENENKMKEWRTIFTVIISLIGSMGRQLVA